MRITILETNSGGFVYNIEDLSLTDDESSPLEGTWKRIGKDQSFCLGMTNHRLDVINNRTEKFLNNVKTVAGAMTASRGSMRPAQLSLDKATVKPPMPQDRRSSPTLTSTAETPSNPTEAL